MKWNWRAFFRGDVFSYGVDSDFPSIFNPFGVVLVSVLSGPQVSPAVIHVKAFQAVCSFFLDFSISKTSKG